MVLCPPRALIARTLFCPPRQELLLLCYLHLGDSTGASQPLGTLHCHRCKVRPILGPGECHLRKTGWRSIGGDVQRVLGHQPSRTI